MSRLDKLQARLNDLDRHGHALQDALNQQELSLVALTASPIALPEDVAERIAGTVNVLRRALVHNELNRRTTGVLAHDAWKAEA